MSIGISNVQLVEMALTGKLEAFDALVKRFQKAVHAVAFAVVSDRDAALDVLQETFIAAFRQLHTLDDASRFGPWVCGIARNQAKQMRRMRYRHASRELPLPEGDMITHQSQTDTLAQSIRDALSCLTDMQADAVTLFYMEGYSIAECAGLLEVPQGTIKRRLHDARQRLKREMIDMVKEHLKEFALPEDYRVVIDKPSRLPSNRTTLSWFKDRWVMVWQDGETWGNERHECGEFTFWLSESYDAKIWSEPRKLHFAEMPGDDAVYYHLRQIFVYKDQLYIHTHTHHGGSDLYSSRDLINWISYPRFRLGTTGRSAFFSDNDSLYLVYPGWVEVEGVWGDRVDMMKSTDGGKTWRWLKSPYWSDNGVTDAAGIVAGKRIYSFWREFSGTDENQRGYLKVNWSNDDGQSWNESITIESMSLHNQGSLSLVPSSYGDILAIAQEVVPASDKVAGGEVWLAFSHDGGQTWSEKAVYSPGSLLDPAIAFAPDGSLILAGSSRSEDGSRPWVVHSHISLAK